MKATTESTVTTAESRAIWDAHHKATEAAMTLGRKMGTPDHQEAKRAYLKAEQAFYRAWQAVDRKTDAVPMEAVDARNGTPETSATGPVAESLDRETVEVGGR